MKFIMWLFQTYERSNEKQLPYLKHCMRPRRFSISIGWVLGPVLIPTSQHLHKIIGISGFVEWQSLDLDVLTCLLYVEGFPRIQEVPHSLIIDLWKHSLMLTNEKGFEYHILDILNQNKNNKVEKKKIKNKKYGY